MAVRALSFGTQGAGGAGWGARKWDGMVQWRGVEWSEGVFFFPSSLSHLLGRFFLVHWALAPLFSFLSSLSPINRRELWVIFFQSTVSPFHITPLYSGFRFQAFFPAPATFPFFFFSFFSLSHSGAGYIDKKRRNFLKSLSLRTRGLLKRAYWYRLSTRRSFIGGGDKVAFLLVLVVVVLLVLVRRGCICAPSWRVEDVGGSVWDWRGDKMEM